MGKIKLEGLNLEVEIPSNIHYFWDGEVNSVAHHYEILEKRYNKMGLIADTKISAEMQEERERANGSCPRFYRFGWKEEARDLGWNENALYELWINCFIKKGLPYDKSIFVRGHEETHALFHMGKLHVLADALVKLTGQTSLSEFLEAAGRMQEKRINEKIADSGGKYALVMAIARGELDYTTEQLDRKLREFSAHSFI